MTWQPHVTVAAVLERDHRFLMVEEDCEGAIVINQPAGHLEQNETLIEAVIRETLEETAWHIHPTDIIGIYQWTGGNDGHTFIRIGFTGECIRHDPSRKLDHGILRALWLTRDELEVQARRLRSPMVMQCVNDYLAGQRYSLDILNEISRYGRSP